MFCLHQLPTLYFLVAAAARSNQNLTNWIHLAFSDQFSVQFSSRAKMYLQPILKIFQAGPIKAALSADIRIFVCLLLGLIILLSHHYVSQLKKNFDANGQAKLTDWRLNVNSVALNNIIFDKFGTFLDITHKQC